MGQRTVRVLVVDDERDTCANLKDILTELEFEVDVAHDGPSALALALVGRKHYDVALLDLKMPGMDGLELYRRMREIQAGTVAIIVTAYASADMASAAQRAGAWQVLSKPVDVAKLLPLVNQAADQPLVLIVDDDQDLCASLWDLFRERGLRVSMAHDVEEAERQVRGMEPRVVLIDMKLPSGDGGSVFRLVRRANPQANTILITGHRLEMAEMVDRVIAEGANAVCYKPFDVETLIATVRRLAG